ncbi:MAG: aminodeoxychorismate synthase component I [Gemmatimonadales bacterium]
MARPKPNDPNQAARPIILNDPSVARPLYQEVAYGNTWDTVRRLANQSGLIFLDSAMEHEHLGRYSFVAADPVAKASSLDGLRQLLIPFPLRQIDDLPPFQGGAAGYLSYEAARFFEPQLSKRIPPPQLPSIDFRIYDRLVAFDHLRQRAFAISTGYPERHEAARKALAAQRLAELLDQLSSEPEPSPGHRLIRGWQSNRSRSEYEAAVHRTVEYILDGDIFQANITQRFSAPIPDGFDPLLFYQALRDRNAAPFAAYLDFGDVIVASSSPERLVYFDGVRAEARPIKGTRRRDAEPEADAAEQRALLTSRKDRAENVMIVDLLRNDLSRVCDPGSIEVPVLCGLESYAAVHHLTSVVTGRLAAGHSAIDLIAAVFPGGSITGAPKLRAMEIIAELEATPRNIYCGSLGYLSFSGRMDLNICIRTALFHGGTASVDTGGGITRRSDPSAEYEESLAKVAPILATFEEP